MMAVYDDHVAHLSLNDEMKMYKAPAGVRPCLRFELNVVQSAL